MSARLPSWFWLLLCVASLAGSVLAWSFERPGRTPATYSAEPAMISGSSEDVADSNPRLAGDLAALGELPVEAAANNPPGPTTVTTPPPSDFGAAAKVLRCVVRGRVTYIDANSACPDGSAGKITILPN